MAIQHLGGAAGKIKCLEEVGKKKTEETLAKWPQLCPNQQCQNSASHFKVPEWF